MLGLLVPLASHSSKTIVLASLDLLSVVVKDEDNAVEVGARGLHKVLLKLIGSFDSDLLEAADLAITMCSRHLPPGHSFPMG